MNWILWALLKQLERLECNLRIGWQKYINVIFLILMKVLQLFRRISLLVEILIINKHMEYKHLNTLITKYSGH